MNDGETGAEHEERAAAIRRSWDSNAEAWTAAVREGRIASRRLVTDEAVLAEVTALGPRRALDVGCGEGWLTRALGAAGVDVLGVDASHGLIAAARSSGGRFEVASYDHLVADPERFGSNYDVAVCNFSLLEERVAPLLAALRELLAPGGALVIQTVHPWSSMGDVPYTDGWRVETFANFEEGLGFRDPMPWYFRTLASWVEELNEAGLRISALKEPLDPASGRPASLLITARTGG